MIILIYALVMTFILYQYYEYDPRVVFVISYFKTLTNKLKFYFFRSVVTFLSYKKPRKAVKISTIYVLAESESRSKFNTEFMDPMVETAIKGQNVPKAVSSAYPNFREETINLKKDISMLRDFNRSGEDIDLNRLIMDICEALSNGYSIAIAMARKYTLRKPIDDQWRSPTDLSIEDAQPLPKFLAKYTGDLDIFFTYLMCKSPNVKGIPLNSLEYAKHDVSALSYDRFTSYFCWHSKTNVRPN